MGTYSKINRSGPPASHARAVCWCECDPSSHRNEQRQFRDPVEIIGIASDEGALVDQRGGGDDAIAKTHFPPLAKFNRLLDNGLGER